MHFLNDLLKHGSYTGFPTIGVETQTMENPHLREAFGMAPKQKGLLINRIAPTCAVAKLLEVGDVLLSFDNEPIANDGTVVYRKHERVAFSALALRHLTVVQEQSSALCIFMWEKWLPFALPIPCIVAGDPEAGWWPKNSMASQPSSRCLTWNSVHFWDLLDLIIAELSRFKLGDKLNLSQQHSTNTCPLRSG